ncbi:uncharacterized, partial [Tachysurus ichikawai]
RSRILSVLLTSRMDLTRSAGASGSSAEVIVPVRLIFFDLSETI